AGDPINQVYFPQTGMISLLVTTGGGKIVETSSVGREGAVGLQCGNGPCRSFTRAIVQIGGNFWVISAPRFDAPTSLSRELRELIFTYTETLWAGSSAKRRLQRDSRRLVAVVSLAVAMRRPDRQRADVTDTGVPRRNARSAAHHSDALGGGTAKARHSQI